MSATKRIVEISITQEGTTMPKLLGGSDPVQILSMVTECTTPEQMEWVKDQFSAAMAHAAAEFRVELQTSTPADGPTESSAQEPEADPADEDPQEDAPADTPEEAPEETDGPEACPPPQKEGSKMSNQTNAHRGLMFLDCPECGSRFFKLVRCEEDATCRCGARIQTEIMAKAEYTCPGCQRITRLWTNTETATLDIKCQCGERFEVPWNSEHRAYMN